MDGVDTLVSSPFFYVAIIPVILLGLISITIISFWDEWDAYLLAFCIGPMPSIGWLTLLYGSANVGVIAAYILGMWLILAAMTYVRHRGLPLESIKSILGFIASGCIGFCVSFLQSLRAVVAARGRARQQRLLLERRDKERQESERNLHSRIARQHAIELLQYPRALTDDRNKDIIRKLETKLIAILNHEDVIRCIHESAEIKSYFQRAITELETAGAADNALLKELALAVKGNTMTQDRHKKKLL